MNKTSKFLTLDAVRDFFPEGAPRYAHIVSAVRIAEQIEAACGRFDGKLILATLYHDLGYSPQWNVTGFHPVDGAIAARDHGLGEDIVQAILYHSGSWREARLMCPDLDGYYASSCLMMEMPLARAVTYCDLHTGPQGQGFALNDRLNDIRHRHATNKPILDILDEYYPRFQAISVEWQGMLESPITTQKVA